MSSKKIDVTRLGRLAKELAEFDGSTEFPNVVNRLKQKEGLRFRKTDSGLHFASMSSVVGKSRRSEEDALRNWANAARRAMIREGR